MKPNRMKEKIARGEPALGCSVMFPSPQIVEMLGYAGFDWVLIDCEHGSIGLADVELMAMACDAVGITPIARPKTNSASDIQSVMDRGVMGVQVPHVNTADDARARWRRSSSAPAPHEGWPPARVPIAGAWVRACPTSPRRPTPSRSCASSSSTRRRSATSMRSSRWRVSTCSSSARRTCRSPWAIPAILRRRPLPRRSMAALAKIVAAGRTPGMPATPENLADVMGKGCRYVYTHLPRLLGVGAAAFLRR